MDIIKFTGKDKKDGVKKAVAFFYDNLEKQESLEVFLAKCRIQSDGKSIYFYPYLIIDINKFRKEKTKGRINED